jgi:hypothetical protein
VFTKRNASCICSARPNRSILAGLCSPRRDSSIPQYPATDHQYRTIPATKPVVAVDFTPRAFTSSCTSAGAPFFTIWAFVGSVSLDLISKPSALNVPPWQMVS